MPRTIQADTREEAQVTLDALMEREGTEYELLERCPRSVSNRYELRWLPKLDEGVCHSIRSDAYYDGKITELTPSTFTTENGRKYRWSAKRRAWNQQGCSYVSAFKGTEADERRDPHF